MSFNAQYLCVAGGGSGGYSQTGNAFSGAGGGAGGLRTNAAYDYVLGAGAYSVIIGGGGPATSSSRANGSDSTFDTITSLGGGAGGYGPGPAYPTSAGSNGGSGGGSVNNGSIGTGQVGQGKNGGLGDNTLAGGGGGGGSTVAGGPNAASNNGGTGGAGSTWFAANYAGGGGGGAYGAGTAGTATYGGGAGGTSRVAGTSGTGNFGGGGGGAGGGASGGPTSGGNGGSGIVIIRAHTADISGYTITGATSTTTDGSDTVWTFTTSGTLTVTAIPAPVADFSGTPLTGTTGVSVAFTDLSTNTPTSWAWTFGDAGTSTSQNPSHTYSTAGSFDVGLTATNAGGSNLATKTGYITVTAPAVATSSGGGTSKRLRSGRIPNKYSDIDLEAVYRKYRGEPEPSTVLMEATQDVVEAIAAPTTIEVLRDDLVTVLLPFMDRAVKDVYQAVQWEQLVQDRVAMQKIIQIKQDIEDDDDDDFMMMVH